MANGVIDPDELVLVQSGLYLPEKAARQWEAFKAQVKAETGVALTITYNSSWPTPPPEIGGLGAWRSLACQSWMWRNKGSNQCAYPGNSVHGVPDRACVDIYNHAAVARTTLERIARANGWIPNTVAKEPWHFRYDGTTTSGGGTQPFPEPIPVPLPQKGHDDMELWSTNPPTVIPPKYLALNGGLVPGKPLYMWLPSGAMPRVTQDQDLIAKVGQQQFNQASSASIVGPISWGWFDQLFDQQLAAYNGIVSGGGGGGGAAVDYSKIATPAQVAAVGQAVEGVPAATVTEHAKRLGNG